jgi:subtilisin family serine protease
VRAIILLTLFSNICFSQIYPSEIANIKEARKLMKNSCLMSSVKVAVLDTGIDFRNPLLSNSKYVNTSEFFGKQGRDNDNNGYINDYNGWNFVNNNNNVSDVFGHGTHVGGIIAGYNVNNLNLGGVCPGVSLIAVKYSNGPGLMSNFIPSLKYAADSGASIVNYSGGGSLFVQAEYDIIRSHPNTLFIVAAGNEKSDLDVNPFYPAAYGLNNIIAVGSIDNNNPDHISERSNYNPTLVEIVTVGKRVISALVNSDGKEVQLSGTSMSTAVVSGVASMLLVEKPSLTSKQIKSILLTSCTKNKYLTSKIKNGCQLDAKQAIEVLKDY